MDEALTDGEYLRRFEVTTGVEVIVQGDASRTRLACRVAENRDALEARAVGLLDAFMRDRGAYELSWFEVLAAQSEDGTDFLLRFNFVANRDPHEYGYTYFEVYFGTHEPPGQPFWPHKLTVGFW